MRRIRPKRKYHSAALPWINGANIPPDFGGPSPLFDT
jgi:hypothetical protein